MRLLFYIVAALISYGSLFPFNFSLGAYDPDLWTSLWYFGIADSGRGDLVANILLFLPYGFLGLNFFSQASLVPRLLFVVVSGFSLAFGLQCLQLYIPNRLPSGADVSWNMIGCLCGALLAMLPAERLVQSRLSGATVARPTVPLLLALLLLAYHWMPFIPSLDLQLLKDNIKLILDPNLEVWRLLHKITLWLIVLHFLRESQSVLADPKFFPAIILLTFTGSLFIVGHGSSTEHALAALLALPAWYLLLQHRYRAQFLAAALAVTLLAATMTPFEVRPQPNAFSWVPMSGALSSNLLLNTMAVFHKSVQYACLIWLLVQCGMRPAYASLATALLLLCSESLQRYFYGPTPEISDPLLALAMGFFLVRYQSWRSNLVANTEAESDWTEESPVESVAKTITDGAEDHVLELNLHEYQYQFVLLCGERLGLAPANLLEQVIALRSGRLSPADSDLATITGTDLGWSLRNRASRWTILDVSLPTAAIKDIEALATRSRKSASYVLRHLIDDKIIELGRDLRAERLALDAARRLRSGILRFRYPLLASGFIVLAAIALLHLTARKPEFLVNPAWADGRTTMVVDLHSHTRFSDGALDTAQLADLALSNGCDALAITDHSDVGASASPRQQATMASVRETAPELILLSGIELNMPSYAGREHVNAIVSSSAPSGILRHWGDLAEQYGAGEAGDVTLLEALADYKNSGEELLVIYNHPSRKVADRAEVFNNIMKWDPKGQLFDAIAGAPGHQKHNVTGSYLPPVLTSDRWDPAIADIGGGWDKLLEQGVAMGGALASSDYHNETIDEPPCAFSRTHVSVPEMSESGLFAGINSGTYWSDHGRLLSSLRFSLEFEELSLPAYPGSVIELTTDSTTAVFNISLQRDKGSFGVPLTTETISNCSSGSTEVVHTELLKKRAGEVTGLIAVEAAPQRSGSCFVRVRVRMYLPSEPDLMAYSNPVMIVF